MCGIVCIIPEGLPLEKDWMSEKAKTMLFRIQSRGFSDLIRTNTEDEYSLGCVRLPIVDEEFGQQPVKSVTQKIILAFNGEIYNYKYLRKEYLSSRPIISESDSEVLANLLEVLGIEITLPLLEGMFAFIAYDIINDKYYFARDQVGIKPLYYSNNKSNMLAASELKAFDHSQDDIIEVPPQCYYDSHTGVNKWKKQNASNNKSLRTLISESVKQQVDTHLPIAVFLSGGIDSSVICYEANKYHSDVTAFAIGKEGSHDLMVAEKFCKDYNYKFNPIYISTSDVLSCIEDTVECIESFEPNLIRAGTLSYLISKKVSSEGFLIALCGEGADELFAGYPDFVKLLHGSNNDFSKMNQVLSIYFEELHLTQLKRVDRTGMKFSLEVRPPFLSSKIISFAEALPADKKIKYSAGQYVTKCPLREAYKDILPPYIVNREKSVFSEGAGFDTNGDHGPFWEYTKSRVTASDIRKTQNEHPDYFLKNHEEVYYFNLLKEKYNIRNINKTRVTVSSV